LLTFRSICGDQNLTVNPRGQKVSAELLELVKKGESIVLETSLERMTGSTEVCPHKAERVLIVDDEPSIRNMLAKVVSGLGFLSDTAQNGKEALKRLGETEYQMVLSDITMPVLV